MLGFGSRNALDRVARELGVELDDARREHVAQEQMRMVLSHTRLGTLVATAAAVLLATHLQGSVPMWQVQAWVAVKLVVALVRVLAATAARSSQGTGAQRWRRIAYALLALDGLVWGVAGARLVAEPVTVASLAGAVVACVSCVATFGLQVRTLATACYVVPILVPTALGLLLRSDEFGVYAGLGLLMLLGLQLATARGAQDRLAAGVLLRLQAQDLAQEKEAALRLAQRQSQAKTEFMGKLSHELRTPLHGILGLARLLHLDLHAQPAQTRRVELIEASGTHLLTLINDLLDVSRAEAGRFEIRRDRFELRSQFDQVAEVFAVRAQDKGLFFHCDAHIAGPMWVQGDAARLRQVLHNLLGNAIKFTREGGVTLRVVQADAAGVVRMEVQDTGLGIAEADQARIFQAFQQSAPGDARPTEGAGLGLTIAREIAQSMGGDITLRSERGVGSTFVFTAWLPPGDVPEAPLPSPHASHDAATQPLPRRVLVAEDDDVNALIVMAYLTGAGVAAERVADGRQAVGHALRETERPELLLMDCRMPVMDGYEATREIRQQEQTLGLARLPIVALTATSGEDDRHKCLAAGMDDFLSKPFQKEQLLSMLARWAPARRLA